MADDDSFCRLMVVNNSRLAILFILCHVLMIYPQVQDTFQSIISRSCSLPGIIFLDFFSLVWNDKREYWNCLFQSSPNLISAQPHVFLRTHGVPSTQHRTPQNLVLGLKTTKDFKEKHVLLLSSKAFFVYGSY